MRRGSRGRDTNVKKLLWLNHSLGLSKMILNPPSLAAKPNLKSYTLLLFSPCYSLWWSFHCFTDWLFSPPLPNLISVRAENAAGVCCRNTTSWNVGKNEWINSLIFYCEIQYFGNCRSGGVKRILFGGPGLAVQLTKVFFFFFPSDLGKKKKNPDEISGR